MKKICFFSALFFTMTANSQEKIHTREPKKAQPIKDCKYRPWQEEQQNKK